MLHSGFDIICLLTFHLLFLHHHGSIFCLSSVHITLGLWSLTSLSFNFLSIFLLLHYPFPVLSSSLYFPFLISSFFSNSLFFSNSFTFPHSFIFISVASFSFYFFPLFLSSILPFSFPGLSLLFFKRIPLNFPVLLFTFFLPCLFLLTFIPFTFLFWFFFSLYLFPYPPPPPIILGIQERTPQREPLRGAPSLSP